MSESVHEMITPLPLLPFTFRIYSSGTSLVPSHWHEHLEVLLILDGQQNATLSDREYTLHKNDIFIVNSGDIHSTWIAHFARVLLLQIPASYLEGSIRDFPSVRFWEFIGQDEKKNAPAAEALRQQLFSLAELFSKKQDGWELSFHARLCDFLYTLYRSFSIRLPDGGKASKNAARLKETLSYIERHYREPVSMKSAAKSAALSPEYFCRSFKKATGITFLEYVNQLRLTHIHEELLSTPDTVTDILLRNGFTNYKVFSRMFKETYGGTPTQIRQQNGNGQ